MNKQKAIIYLRKSTDREDRQQISIETQRQYCERLAEDYNFETVIIEDHRSAKDDGKRPGFKQLLSLCKKGKFDYVIAYDPTRISRNTIDTAYFTELINKNHIKGFYASENRQFFNGNDIFSALMLGISFLMSKADNQMRSSNTRKKMEVLFQAGRVMSPAPFGYKNHQFFDEFGRIEHDVLVVEQEAELVKKGFEMRRDGYQFKEITAYFAENGYKRGNSSIEQMLKNPFYIGIQRGKFGEAEIKMPGYAPIISCKLFEEVNSIRRKIRPKKNISLEASLKGMIYGEDGYPMVAYETRNRTGKGYIYYRCQNHSIKKINYSEKYMFTRFDEYMKQFDFSEEFLNDMERVLMSSFTTISEMKTERILVLEEIQALENERKLLMKKLLEGVILDEDYREFSLGQLKQKKILEEKLKSISNDKRNSRELIIKWVKLIRNLYPVYKIKSPLHKSNILKGIQVKLFARDNSSVSIQENEVFSKIKSCGIWYGSPNRIRTYDLPVNSRLLYR